MALRVLLADNSETIKKVIQLTLQDFGLDLRIVNLGVDVIEVATQFKPDIIFVDILLQKKSGYDVSRDLKLHEQLKTTPVILMWSGFMEFDEAKAKESLADARLEKPFEASQLRQLVQKLVKKAGTHPLSAHLDFPDVPKAASKTPANSKDPLTELEKIKNESQKFQPVKVQVPNPQALSPRPASLESEEFEMKPLQNSATTSFNLDAEETALFQVDFPEDSDLEDMEVDIDPIAPIEDMSFLLNPEAAPTQKAQPQPSQTPPPLPKTTPVPSSTASVPDEKMIEKMVHEKIHEIVEKISWQLVPEIASQMIKKELERLLKQNDTQP